jgi:MinD superfamily P-loop ATPase
VSGGAVKCPKCGGEARVAGENKYVCEGCGTAFYACPVCGATFFTSQQLGGHMRTHGRRDRADAEILGVLEEIAGRLEKVEERLGRIEQILASLSAQPARLQTAEDREGGELPSYARDNPWLRILSSR